MLWSYIVVYEVAYIVMYVVSYIVVYDVLGLHCCVCCGHALLCMRFWSFPARCAYGVATISRIDEIIGLFGRISSLL